MQITINKEEIKQAIVDYVAAQGISLKNAKVEVGITASRGLSGPTATVDIEALAVKTPIVDAEEKPANVTNLVPKEEATEETSDDATIDTLVAEDEESSNDAEDSGTESIFK